MANLKTGRNDPCPCGSGKKYKKCCLSKQTLTNDATSDLRDAMQNMKFSSIEEANAFANEMLTGKNQGIIDDFAGLSPDQMHSFLYSPFESPQYVKFMEPDISDTEAPVWRLFMLLADAIGENGLKATAKGNLPQKFCKESAEIYIDEFVPDNIRFIYRVNKEDDFRELHILRLLAELAGLIRLEKNRFVLSDECLKLWLDKKYGAIFYRLFKSFVTDFNWAFSDRYEDFKIIQDSFLFSLYILYQFGDTARSETFYEEKFLNAFPMLVNEAKPNPHCTEEDTVMRCYTVRAIQRFAEFFGLISRTLMENEKPIIGECNIRNKNLLRKLVRFIEPQHLNQSATKH